MKMADFVPLVLLLLLLTKVNIEKQNTISIYFYCAPVIQWPLTKTTDFLRRKRWC